tara:strand:- start:4951 stop:5952 length:1002 start_codon:yes stop_codon:yes gene_type:complete
MAPSLSLDLRERARFWISPTADGAWDLENLAHVGVGASLGPLVGRVEVRGTHSFGDGPGIALQQAYGGFALDNGLSLMAGRMELSWHNGRLIDEVDWTVEGQPIDGVTLVFSKDKAEAEVAYLKRDSSNDHHVVAVRGGARLGDPLLLDAVAIIVADNATETSMATVGAYASGAVGIFKWELDGYGQFVRVGDLEGERRFTLGVRAGVSPEHSVRPYIGGGLDVVSAGFDNLLGNDHIFYGLLDVPGLTDNGLLDGFARIGVSPYSKMRVVVDLHAFLNPWADVKFVGFEADIEATWTLFTKLDLTAAAWILIPGGDGASPTVTMLMQTDWRF